MRCEQRLRRPDLRRTCVQPRDLPVPAREGEFELGRDFGRRRAFPLVAGKRVGDQRLQVDAELIVEIRLRPTRVERAEAQARPRRGSACSRTPPTGTAARRSSARRGRWASTATAPRARLRAPRWWRRPHRLAAPARLSGRVAWRASRRSWPRDSIAARRFVSVASSTQDVDRAGGNVDGDKVVFLDEADHAALGRFRRNVPDRKAGRAAGEAPVGDERAGLAEAP